MENAVKALEMAAGVLLGVILMALVAYFFTNISSWPQNEEDIMSAEQLADFNLQYEVYEKSKMYGVDIISCLNKVISNNNKYAQGGAFLEGNAGLGDYKQRENFWINVRFKLKLNKDDPTVSAMSGTTLYETLEVYHCNESNQERTRASDTQDKFGNTLPQIAVNSAGLKNFKNAIVKVGPEYTSLRDTDMLPRTTSLEEEVEVTVFSTGTKYLDAASVESGGTDGYISLIYKDSSGNASDMNPEIINLLNRIQTLATADASSSFSYTFRNKTKADYRIWTQVIWKTVLNDFKKRKFTCEDISYNEATGRVKELVFKEI